MTTNSHLLSESEYFESYADLSVHRTMLADRARTCAYREVLRSNMGYLKGKVVLDVGCGTGILSLFALQFGARKVYGVEASNMAQVAKQILCANNYSSESFVLFHQRFPFNSEYIVLILIIFIIIIIIIIIIGWRKSNYPNKLILL
jgi:ubiquinone/menaquinone biosynthesis C-methylase UbiE